MIKTDKTLLGQHPTFLLALFILSLCVRLLLFFYYTNKNDNHLLAFDSLQYHGIAQQLVNGNGFATPQGSPTFFRLPGYPLFLAAQYKFFNFDIFNTLIVQIILASLIPLLVFLLALTLFPAQIFAAKGAGIIAAIHVGLVVYAGLVASESLFILFFLLFLIFLARAMLDHKNQCFFGAGITLGIASLLRAVGPYCITLSFIFILFCDQTWRNKMLFSLSLFIGWLIPVGWWLIRNFILTGSLFFHSLPGPHFLHYSAVHTRMGYVNFGDQNYFDTKKKLYTLWDQKIQEAEIAENRSLNEYERSLIAEKLAFSIMQEHPWITIKNCIVNMARTCGTLYSSLFLFVPQGTVYEHGTSLWFKIKLYLTPSLTYPWLIICIYWEIILMLLILFGCGLFCIQAIRNKQYLPILLSSLLWVGLFIVLTLGYGCARLRLPIEPLLIILACVGWRNFYDNKKHF